MKPMTALMTAAVFSVLSLNACGGSEKSRIQEQTEARFQLNPHPKQAYRLRIKINDAPGPLKLIGKFGVGYKAENCTYIINKIEGVPAKPEKNIQTDIRQLGEFEYETVVYADALLDEDYFGEGVCHWQPEGFGFSLKATGSPEETEFNFSDIMKYLLEKKTLTNYYWKWSYPYSRKEDGTLYTDSVDFGIESPEIYSAEEHKEMFTIAVTLEEISL
ncbi:hypothetical protein [Neisseria oralis]|jgi:secreted protein|uniref:hypothetical protein n=1 Tax=Neisseria oralis TaxID=1107316 RepID=UPI0027E3EFC6|nr:hypothetical protein [Neisseria oralis]